MADFAAFGLEGKQVLVTGAGKGIGAACARTFVAAGAKVIAVARTESDLHDLARACGPDLTTWCHDVTSADFIERLAALEVLDVLVNNAGFNRPQSVSEVDVATLDEMLNLNVRSVFLASQAAAGIMQRQGAGAIVNMSSQMGRVGSPGRSVYCMTKHAIEGLTRAMAVELAPVGIRVNAVAPTFVETPMTAPMLADPAFAAFVASMLPMGRIGKIEEVVHAVLYLSSALSSLTTGHSLSVDGGWTAQ